MIVTLTLALFPGGPRGPIFPGGPGSPRFPGGPCTPGGPGGPKIIEVHKSSSKGIGFAITTLPVARKRLTPFFHPIRSETKTNPSSFARVFPRFASSTCFYFEFWLVQWIVCVPCDWLERLLWFGFYDIPLKTTLSQVWWAYWIVCVFFDWPRWLPWFWFHDPQLKLPLRVLSI